MGIANLLAAAEAVAAEEVKLSSADRARLLRYLLPAFGALVLLALTLVGLVWWTARTRRRRMQSRLGPSQTVQDPWYKKPPPSDVSSELDEPGP